jgi:gamma-tubulin complex component 3
MQAAGQVPQSMPGGQEPLNEDLIVRDLLFVFQGINGQYIHFSHLDDGFIVTPNAVVSPAAKKLINELSELGWLFRKVNDWLSRNFELQAHCTQVT